MITAVESLLFVVTPRRLERLGGEEVVEPLAVDGPGGHRERVLGPRCVAPVKEVKLAVAVELSEDVDLPERSGAGCSMPSSPVSHGPVITLGSDAAPLAHRRGFRLSHRDLLTVGPFVVLALSNPTSSPVFGGIPCFAPCVSIHRTEFTGKQLDHLLGQKQFELLDATSRNG